MTEAELRWATLMTEAMRGLVSARNGVHLVRPSVAIWVTPTEFGKLAAEALDGIEREREQAAVEWAT